MKTKPTPENVDRVDQVLAPGIWTDKNGGLHFSSPDLCKQLGVAYTEENHNRLKEVLLDIMRKQGITCPLIERQNLK